MRIPFTLVLMVFFYTTLAQTPESFHVFLSEAKTTDSGMVVVEVSTLVKISDYKPETILVPKSYGGGYSVDRRPRKFYYQPKGEMSFLVYPKRDVLANFQPHIVLNVVGLSTYLSGKYGAGVTFRKYGTSLGFLYGSYLRRLDVKADVSYRAKTFEESFTYGGYLNIDKEYGACSFLFMKEKTLNYHDVGMKIRLGSVFEYRYVPSGLNLEFRTTTFIGSGFGLSYTTTSKRHDLGVIFSIPDGSEKNRQRRFYNFLGSGVSINWKIQVF